MGSMENKLDIAKDWLPRYTGMPLDEFGHHILLTNFSDYVENFANKFNSVIRVGYCFWVNAVA